MLPAHFAALLLPLLSPADDPQLTLEIGAGALEFHVSGPDQFLGGVILSLNPAVCQYFQGLPPLLCDYAVLGVGLGQNGEYVAVAAERALPPGIVIHAQGVIASGAGIASTSVLHFVLDGSAPAGN
ncbi:MAG: hypothetical protein U1E73_03755 [Planctomycetota bacterium]